MELSDIRTVAICSFSVDLLWLLMLAANVIMTTCSARRTLGFCTLIAFGVRTTEKRGKHDSHVPMA